MTKTRLVGTDKIVTLKGDPYICETIFRELHVRWERTGRVEFAPLARHAYYGPIIAQVEGTITTKEQTHHSKETA